MINAYQGNILYGDLVTVPRDLSSLDPSLVVIMCERQWICKPLMSWGSWTVVIIAQNCLLWIRHTSYILQVGRKSLRNIILSCCSVCSTQRLLSSPSLEIWRTSKTLFRFMNDWAPDLGYRVGNLIPQSDGLLRQQLLSVTLIGQINFSLPVSATNFLTAVTSLSAWIRFLYHEDGADFLSYTM